MSLVVKPVHVAVPVDVTLHVAAVHEHPLDEYDEQSVEVVNSVQDETAYPVEKRRTVTKATIKTFILAIFLCMCVYFLFIIYL